MALERMQVNLEHPGTDSETAKHLSRYEFAKSFTRGRSVLDAACGFGYGSDLLARSARSVFGIDISDEAIRYARAHHHADNIEYACVSATELSVLDRQFDVVVSFETIEHIDAGRHFLEQVIHVLSPDGVMLISTPNRTRGSVFDRPSNSFHVREWSEAEFLGILSIFFGQVDLYGQWFHFRRNRVPGTRLLRLATLMLLDRGARQVHHQPVVAPMSEWGRRLNLVPEYVVAVCRKPIR